MKKRNKRIAIIVSVIVILIITVLACFFNFSIIYGTSMNDTFHTGDIKLYKRSVLIDEFNRGDIIVFKHEKDKVVKRVIALEGETISITDNVVYINDVALSEPYAIGDSNDLAPITVQEGTVFVLGDNRTTSIDSRSYGTINISTIKGKFFKGQ